MKRNLLKKNIPIWFVIPLIMLISGSSMVVFATLTVQNRTYTSIFGEIVDVTEELNVTTNGIDISPSVKSEAGTSSGSPITLTGAGATVRTAIAKGNYYYTVELSVVTTSANTQYNVTLYEEQSDVWVGVDSLYVQQSASPSVGDKAFLSWDIGASLSSSTYKIEIETYT